MTMYANINGEQVLLSPAEEAAILAAQAAAAVSASKQAAQAAYLAAINAGVAVTSTSTPAIDGTYPITDSAVTKITSEQVYIATTGKFTNGQTARAWLDVNGSAHTFPTTALFTSFAEGLAQYVDSLVATLTELQAGNTVSWPAAAITVP